MTSLSILFLATIALYTFLYARRGYRKGLTFSLFRLAALILSASAAVFLSIGIAAPLAEEGIVLLTELLSEGDADPVLSVFSDPLLLLLKMLLSLVLYVPLFNLLRFLIHLIAALITRLLGVKKAKRWKPEYYKENEAHYITHHRKIAAGIGALSGLLAAVILLTPLVGLLGVASSAIGFYHSIAGDDVDTSTEILIIERFANDPCVSTLDACGSGMLFDFITTADVHSDSTSLPREIEALSSADYESIITLLSSFSSLETLDTDAAEALIDRLCDSRILQLTLASVVRTAASSWLNYESYFEIPRPSYIEHDSIEGFMNDIFYAFTTTSYETVKADLHTLLSLAAFLRDKVATLDFEDYNVMISALMNDGLLQEIRTIIQENPHMMTVSFAIDDLVMSVVSLEILEVFDCSEEDKEVLFGEFASILTDTMQLEESTRIIAIAHEISQGIENFSDGAITLPDGLTEKIATQLIQGIDTGGQPVTPEDVEGLLMEFIHNGQLSEVIPEGDLPDELPDLGDLLPQ